MSSDRADAQGLLLLMPLLAAGAPDLARLCYTAGQLYARLLPQQQLTQRDQARLAALITETEQHLGQSLVERFTADLHATADPELTARFKAAIRYLAHHPEVSADVHQP